MSNQQVEDAWTIEFSKVCPCRTLFEPKYLRTHRVGGTKVLRCFPHCCPSHLYSSVCGSSVTLRVHGPQLGHVVTYLHFDAAYEDPLRVGDTIMENAVLDNLRRQTHTAGEWIASQKCRRWCASLAREVKQRVVGTTAGSVDPRDAFHSLRAYVFAREPPRLRVLAVAQSPPFVVMSYRRACKACQRQSPEDEQAQLKCECDGIYRLPPLESNRTALTAAVARRLATTEMNSPPSCEDSMESSLASIHYFLSTFPASILAACLDLRFDAAIRWTTGSPLPFPILRSFQAHCRAPSDRLAAWS
ncbi:hypothetical protein LEN26_009279 [Aphanomyces euteiches]|nr:hypothetical protein LEN26_009279 [Aphanomyces euteiches]